MTGIVAHTYPEWWLKLAGQVAHWSTDYSVSEIQRECILSEAVSIGICDINDFVPNITEP